MQKKKSVLYGELPDHELIEGEFVAIRKSVLESLIAHKDCVKLIGLYMFYLYMAKWQNNWSIRATTGYVAKGLKWSNESVIKYKTMLREMSLVDDIVRRGKEGKIEGHYVRILKPTHGENHTQEKPYSGNSDTNTIYSKLNTISNNKILDIQSPTETEQVIDNKQQSPARLILPVRATPNTSAGRLLKLYGVMWKKKYGSVPQVNYGRDLSLLKKTQESLGEYTTALVIILFMNWKGVDGNDNFIEKVLSSTCHSLIHLGRQVTPILTYAKNVLKLDVNDEDKIKSTVEKKLKEYNIYEQD